MKNYALIATLAFATLFTACKNDKKDDPVVEEDITQEDMKQANQESERVMVKVMMEPKSETNTQGRIQFVDENGAVSMMAKFRGLTPGMHAIHLHEKADCSAPDGTSTGGHWNPTFAQHGKWGDEAGYHKGDIGNFEADADGNGSIEFKTDEWCIGCGDDTKDILGKAVIVHEGVDDFVTQPTGDAGGRISCGGIIK
ncbi:superoxide dismutase family protein [Planktosalinus lacus]|uniref:Superoxide dismutase [Cu-Zn] n=1 Tax=Planktosalinus lacus TaxID=1526573 RepID=A0A8J2VBK3_9FLAO|nr:superoxide dismutase family protein [Planktosalinus lacus]GGD96387.1 superoxide dismutase [Cu-Zn] [Planktosalinus lacus]